MLNAWFYRAKLARMESQDPRVYLDHAVTLGKTDRQEFPDLQDLLVMTVKGDHQDQQAHEVSK